MNERIKKLRRALELTQQVFAERIGLKQNSIALIESGKRNISQQAILSICREFGVNKIWLETGHGEMFSPAASNALDALAADYNITHGDYILIEKFLRMRPESRKIIVDYVMEVAAAIESDDIPAETPAYPGKLDIDAEVESYRVELELQEKAKAGLSASDGASATG